MRWARINAGLLDDFALQSLPPDEFKARFTAAIRGEKNQFTPWIKLDAGRVFSAAWKVIRAAIFARDDYTCAYCGVRGGRLECDHIVPVSRGGSNARENLTTACFSCNRAKRDKLVSEWKGGEL